MTRIIIDTDPGQDDAIALLLALASPELEILGITTVAGNVPLELTTRNALMMVELADRPDVPVFVGEAGPMRRSLVTAEAVHGKTGIDGADLPEPALAARPEPATTWLADTLRDAAEPVTICTLGPLTNVGVVLDDEPSLAAHVERLVLMGGGYSEGGNTTPAAEFNIFVDPEAADIVFRSGIDLVQMPLDVTHQALAGPERVERFAALGTVAGEAVAGMLKFFERHDVAKYGIEGAPLHDPTVIAFLLQPELFSGRRVNVVVETGSELTAGMTVVDWWGVTDREANCLVVREIDADGFFDLLVERIGRL